MHDNVYVIPHHLAFLTLLVDLEVQANPKK